MSRIFVGIPCYHSVTPETLEDYFRFAYHLGRRIPEHDFLVGVKPKTEQFRARNSITEGALQTSTEFMLMLDDDHVIEWEGTAGPDNRYEFIRTLITHMRNDPKIGIVGALYYHRGGRCGPVLMKLGNDGGYYWMRDDEITGELQEVAVTGGGCMLIRMSMFDRIRAPWFEPEFDLGTDLQICKKAQEAGFKVCCDTSIQVGHVRHKREVITPHNRHRIAMENAEQLTQHSQGLEKGWMLQSALALYRQDAEEYLGMPLYKMGSLAEKYDMEDLKKYGDDLEKYYSTRGNEQLARQVLFHHVPFVVKQMDMWLNMINTQTPGYGIDVGCGSAPVSFELAMRGHHMDFIDIDGAGAYEFTKWRVKKRGISNRCGFAWNGPYDYALMLDSIEHLKNWDEILQKVIDHLKPGGGLITNYFLNMDYDNPEHISMNKDAVKKFLVSKGIYPLSEILWVKKDLGFMDKKEEEKNERNFAAHGVA